MNWKVFFSSLACSLIGYLIAFFQHRYMLSTAAKYAKKGSNAYQEATKILEYAQELSEKAKSDCIEANEIYRTLCKTALHPKDQP